MRLLLLITILFSIASCDDGDFEVPSFEFDPTVNTCGNYVLYRTNSDKTEALILEFEENEIKQEEAVYSIAISSENCNYRIFDDSIDANYFCSDVPPVQPIVTKNWIAVAGTNNSINIETTNITDESGIVIGYKHQITLTNLVLESDSESMTFETYNFGNFETSI